MAYLIALMVREGVDFLIPVLDDVMPRVLLNAKEFRGDKDRIADLLDLVLEGSVPLDSTYKNSLVQYGKEFLMSSGWSAEELRPLCRLLEKRPGLFSEEDMELARDSLKETVEMVESDKDNVDAETLREEARALARMAEQLGADIAADIGRIEDYADELESGMTDEPEEADYAGSRAGFERWCSNDTIASLFSTLKDQ